MKVALCSGVAVLHRPSGPSMSAFAALAAAAMWRLTMALSVVWARAGQMAEQSAIAASVILGKCFMGRPDGEAVICCCRPGERRDDGNVAQWRGEFTRCRGLPGTDPASAAPDGRRN